MQSNQNYTPLDQKKNYLTPGNINKSSRLNSLNTCIEQRKSQHILASFHQHNQTVTKDMIWQPGRRINIGFWHLTNTPLYNTSEWITFISKTFTEKVRRCQLYLTKMLKGPMREFPNYISVHVCGILVKKLNHHDHIFRYKDMKLLFKIYLTSSTHWIQKKHSTWSKVKPTSLYSV